MSKLLAVSSFGLGLWLLGTAAPAIIGLGISLVDVVVHPGVDSLVMLLIVLLPAFFWGGCAFLAIRYGVREWRKKPIALSASESSSSQREKV
jgi:hypothetical protein